MGYLVHIAPKGGILIFIWVGSENCYAYTEWHLIFPDNDVDMSLEYPYAQHLLFQTCSSLIMPLQKLPKITFYRGCKSEFRHGWNSYVVKKQTPRGKVCATEKQESWEFNPVSLILRFVWSCHHASCFPSQRNWWVETAFLITAWRKTQKADFQVAASQAKVWFQRFQAFIWECRRDLIFKNS